METEQALRLSRIHSQRFIFKLGNQAHWLKKARNSGQYRGQIKTPKWGSKGQSQLQKPDLNPWESILGPEHLLTPSLNVDKFLLRQTTASWPLPIRAAMDETPALRLSLCAKANIYAVLKHALCLEYMVGGCWKKGHRGLRVFFKAKTKQSDQNGCGGKSGSNSFASKASIIFDTFLFSQVHFDGRGQFLIESC